MKGIVLTVFYLLALCGCGGGDGSTVVSASLTADPVQIGVGQRTTLTARSTATVVEDQSVAGEPIEFRVSSNESGGSFDSKDERLNSQGVASAVYRGGTRSGVDIVEAVFATGARATVTITVGSGVVVGSLELTANGGNIQALVKDVRGSAVQGVLVNFSTTNGVLSESAVETNVNGIAATVITDATGSGSATVYAHAGGMNASVRTRVPVAPTPGGENE